MNLTTPSQGKFACIALRTWASEKLPESFPLADNAFVLSRTPFAVDEFWTKSLGTIQARQFDESNLFLIAFSGDSATSENDLKRFAESYYYGLLLQGMAYSERSLILAGDTGPNGLHVISAGWENTYNKPYKVIPPDVDVEALETCMLLASAIEEIYADKNGQDHLRLRKGFNTYLMAIKERQAHFRLHHFVRSIEALIKPERRKTTDQFIHRCQFFAGRSASARAVLTELYEMRSAAEHLNPLRDKLGKYATDEHENLIALRTYQAELLAGHIYRRVLLDKKILDLFRDDDSISQLWKRPDHEQIANWGSPIDLVSSVQGKFFDYL